jgi:hypothetical protein
MESGRTDAIRVVAGGWDVSLLQHVVDLNRHLLSMLVQAAGSDRGPAEMALATRLRSAWLQLSAGQLARLAACPYVLVDAQLTITDRWAALLQPGVRDVPAMARSHSGQPPLASPLIRRLLVLAWHLARANPLAARITLGMSESCAALIAGTRLDTLEALADARPEWIRPLWEDRPEIWQQLLAAALSDHEGRLRPLQLRGLQLLAARMQPLRTIG